MVALKWVAVFLILLSIVFVCANFRTSLPASAPDVHIAFLATSVEWAPPVRQLIANIRSLSAGETYFYILTELEPATMRAALGDAIQATASVSVHQVLGNDAALRHPTALAQYDSICKTTTLGSRKYHNCKKMVTHVLHLILPDVDRVVMMDLDMFLVGDPADLWQHFSRFRPEQVIGMVLEQQSTYNDCWDECKVQYKFVIIRV